MDETFVPPSNSTPIYAISACGIVMILILISSIYHTTSLRRRVAVRLSEYIIYPYILDRHRLVGPWTCAGVCMYAVYLTANLLCLLFPAPSVPDVGRRAGELSLINMAFLFLTPNLSILADILHLSLRTCRIVHHATAWMSVGLLSLHALISILLPHAAFPLNDRDNLFTVIGSASAVMAALLSFPSVRDVAYEFFLRIHQGMAALLFYCIWRHIYPGSILERSLLLGSLACLGLISLLQLIFFCHRNALFTHHDHPRAYVFVDQADNANQARDGAIRVQVILPRPIQLDAGQYINLWMPTVSPMSWTQLHPFTVTSWSQKGQRALDLYVEARRGFTATLRHRARSSPNGSVSYAAFFTGPHGLSVNLDRYECVLLVASGSGIATVLPYIQKLINGHNASSSCTRRVHLVWQLKSLDMALPAQASVNALLKDDSAAVNSLLDEASARTLASVKKILRGYIFTISMYVESGELEILGSHDRAFVYKGKANYRDVIETEVSADAVERVTGTAAGRGKLHVLVSATAKVRDEVRHATRAVLDHGVTMSELEFQPHED